MGSYLDTSWADLRALTRLRRSELKAARRPETLRVRAFTHEFHRDINDAGKVVRSRARMLRWRRDQWRAGVRRCAYCACEMSHRMGHPRKVTVDHRQPVSRDGRDEPANYAMCCLTCNARKGSLTEAEFRELLSRLAMAAE